MVDHSDSRVLTRRELAESILNSQQNDSVFEMWMRNHSSVLNAFSSFVDPLIRSQNTPLLFAGSAPTSLNARNRNEAENDGEDDGSEDEEYNPLTHSPPPPQESNIDDDIDIDDDNDSWQNGGISYENRNENDNAELDRENASGERPGNQTCPNGCDSDSACDVCAARESQNRDRQMLFTVDNILRRIRLVPSAASRYFHEVPVCGR